MFDSLFPIYPKLRRLDSDSMIIERYDKSRGRKVYDIRLRNEYGKMKYFSVGHTSKTLVREYEAKLKNKIKEWRMFPDRKLKSATFREFVTDEYLPKHAKMKRTERDYISICKKLNRQEWADRNIDAIQMHDVEPYLSLRYTQVSVYTSNREFSILMGIFTKAEQWGYIPKGTNPCKAIKMKREEPRQRILSTTEIDSLLGVCRKGFVDFRVDEFTGGLTIRNLCVTLTKDGHSPTIDAKPNSIEWLNGLLAGSDLYDRVTNIKKHPPLSKRARNIEKQYKNNKDDADLLRLNRLMIEELYPLQAPKMPKKATGLSEREAVDLRDMIEVTINSGTRKSELLNLKVSDINFETGMIKILGKGGKTRFVPINLKLKEILKRRVQGRNKFIFGNGKVAPKDFKKAFGSACERAGIEDARPHDLRRTFGTRCVMIGVSPKTLQKWMGHENIHTTMKYYVQVPEQFEKEAIERLSDFGKNHRQGNSSYDRGSQETL